MSELGGVVERLFERSRAIADADQHVITLGVAGCAIRVVSAGPAMLDFVLPAFAHLERLADDVAPDLTVTTWDSRSTGEPYPDLPLVDVGPLATGIVTAPGLLMSYYSVGRAMSVLDRTADQAMFVVDDASSLPPWERPSPLRTILSWWFMDRGMLLAHAAAVSTDDGAALLVGPSGSGKSSTALACLAGGMGYLGDDYVLIDLATNEVWSLFGSAKLVADHLMQNPGLMTSDGVIVHEAKAVKHYGWPSTEFPERARLRAPIRALVLPTVTRGPECRLVPSTAARALLALAPSTMFQSPALKETAFSLSTDLVRRFSPFRLELGEGVEQVPAMLAKLIRLGVERA